MEFVIAWTRYAESSQKLLDSSLQDYYTELQQIYEVSSFSPNKKKISLFKFYLFNRYEEVCEPFQMWDFKEAYHIATS